ncbi:hypothetical protein TCE0_039r12764 [Talaromyces pinophilus]|uniref:Uncharacterized protein n=1 Tax=Talaromyces pinophilus TaxID=128442 RepID=A0A6N4SL25_TALPI|nr:hypothetical protein TCE0_039r12764 [Talaromyces pinophilus]
MTAAIVKRILHRKQIQDAKARWEADKLISQHHIAEKAAWVAMCKRTAPGMDPLNPDYRSADSYVDNDGAQYYTQWTWDDVTKDHIRQLNKWTAHDRAEEDGARADYYGLLHECEGEAVGLESIRASIEELKEQFRD